MLKLKIFLDNYIYQKSRRLVRMLTVIVPLNQMRDEKNSPSMKLAC
jgi:hypothetical protein